MRQAAAIYFDHDTSQNKSQIPSEVAVQRVFHFLSADHTANTSPSMYGWEETLVRLSSHETQLSLIEITNQLLDAERSRAARRAELAK